MPLLLERYNRPGEYASIDPHAGRIRVLPDHGLGAITNSHYHKTAGWFDILASPAKIAAFYRDEAGTWQLHLGDNHITLTDDLNSEYEPRDPGRLPLKWRGTDQRIFRLVRGRQVLFEHRYRGDSIWERLIDALQGTSRPTPAYDLLFEVHRILHDGDRRHHLIR